MSIEADRLTERGSGRTAWMRWGPYVGERSWGTLREDCGTGSTPRESFPLAQARSRAYRWNEDGLGGFSDDEQRVCLGVALWNEHDAHLKERLESADEDYAYVDALPTYAYARMRLRYGEGDGALAVCIAYAKADHEDILCRITVTNPGSTSVPVHVLPQIWFRNTWSWGYDPTRPRLTRCDTDRVCVQHRHLGQRWWSAVADSGQPELLFTENESAPSPRSGLERETLPYSKDAIDAAVISGDRSRTNPANTGTKCAAHFRTALGAGCTFTVRVRFSNLPHHAPFDNFDLIFNQRLRETNEFYAAMPQTRTASAVLLWNQQFYHFNMRRWSKGDSGCAAPAERRREHAWLHLNSEAVFPVGDKWAQPYVSALETSVEIAATARLNPALAKRQFERLLQLMHPSGQMPDSENAPGRRHPPLLGWAALRLYAGDLAYLKECFEPLRRNFTWWMRFNERDHDSVFDGGSLGMPGLSPIDRSAPPGLLTQADATGWMALYSLHMMDIALRLTALHDNYEKLAVRYLERFIYCANGLFNLDDNGVALWDEGDGFFYDVLHMGDSSLRLKLRSYSGMVPLLAVQTVSPEQLSAHPRLQQRLEWFMQKRPDLINRLLPLTSPGKDGHYRLAVMTAERLKRVLTRLFAPDEFLSPVGLRSVSQAHRPYEIRLGSTEYTVEYTPDDPWCGAVHPLVNWFMVEALDNYAQHFGESLLVQGNTLRALSDHLARRLLQVPGFPEYADAENGTGRGARMYGVWAAMVAALQTRA